MPSIATYTSYESLLFLQSVARHGADTPALEDISARLTANEYIRENDKFDTNRFTTAALRGLYEEFIEREREADKAKTADGHAHEDGTNPRKRKFSASPTPPATEPEHEDQALLEGLVERLYVKFKEQAIEEIRQDEQEFHDLTEEINDLQTGLVVDGKPTGKTEHTSRSTSVAQYDGVQQSASAATGENAPQPIRDASTSRQDLQIEKKDSVERTAPSAEPHAPEAPRSTSLGGEPPSTFVPQQYIPARPNSGTGNVGSPSESYTSRSGQAPPPLQYQSHSGHRSSPGAFHNRTLPPPSPQRTNYGPISHQPGLPHGSPSHPVPVLPFVPGMSPMGPPGEYPGGHRRVSSGQGRGSPAPFHQPSPQSNYHQYPLAQPPWPQHAAQMQHPLYPHQSPYANNQFYGPSQPGQGPPLHTPTHPQYMPHPQTAPADQYGKGRLPWQTAASQPWNLHPESPAATPVPRLHSHFMGPNSSRSSTPWKKRPEVVGNLRFPSPTRVDREVSPLTERGSPTPGSPKREENSRTKSAARKESRSNRRGRADSTASPAAAKSSRSQSVASYTSEAREEQPAAGRARGRRIKPEPPSTPAPLTSDVESQRSSGRRGRGQLSISNVELPSSFATGSVKRKRPPPHDGSPSPSLMTPVQTTSQRQQHAIDTDLVAVSKNFAKTAQLLLSEIGSHRLAGIFAKPLSEREAPGYKHLILRPQDLKSIRAAVSKGNRVAITAIDELEEQAENGQTPTPTKANLAGTGIYFVKRTEDLVPPKGIVNSAQLEMELMRLFANAVMFNPLPASERAMGPQLKLQRRGGESHQDAQLGGSPSSDGDSSQPDGTGIIQDAREMFTDVLKSITDYRNLEDERMNGNVEEGAKAGQMGLGLRGGSLSASSAIGDEGASVLEEGDHGATSTSRKRRRVGDI